MDEGSPFFVFDPESRGSLFYKFDNKMWIEKADIDLVLEKDGEAAQDPRMLPILIASHKGLLNSKRGRPNHKDSFSYKGRVFWAAEDVQARAKEIHEERKGLSKLETRALKDPMEQAADEIAAKYRFRKSGRSLLNDISSQKSAPLFGDGKDRKK
ncbi:hypothetical protein [Sphingorhabdus sp. Alg231-15]|uniref:hypothetical protein n=1 Tax=Sphingorhabdus sp. Alg231-15 TaxID=1922222 RepID=UPI000D54EB1F